jgi:hypothetical protein
MKEPFNASAALSGLLEPITKMVSFGLSQQVDAAHRSQCEGPGPANPGAVLLN